MVGRRADVCWDCWTRVLRRSTGWRRTAVVRPDERPARKWKVAFEAIAFCVLDISLRSILGGSRKSLNAQAEVLN